MAEMSRRSFILGGLASAAAVGALWVARARPDDLVVRILRRHLWYLIIPDEDLRAFAADAYADMDDLQTRALRLFSLGYPLYSAAPEALLAREPRIAAIEDIVVTQFLLSSDFFLNGEDESKPVRYLGYFKPRQGVPCLNPLLPSGLL